MDLNPDKLTDRQFWLAGKTAVRGYPTILQTNHVRIAKNLERLGYGSVEDGANGERIFRLNQAGEDAFVAYSRAARLAAGLR